MKRSVVGLFVALVLSAWAFPGLVARADGPIDQQVLEISSLLQCRVCENSSVAESNAELARQMRAIIREKLEAGETKDQILRYFVDRYGEVILREPPKSGFTSLVWLAPLIGLVVGGIALGAVLRRLARGSGTSEPEPPLSEPERAQYESLIQQDLEQWKRQHQS